MPYPKAPPKPEPPPTPPEPGFRDLIAAFDQVRDLYLTAQMEPPPDWLGGLRDLLLEIVPVPPDTVAVANLPDTFPLPAGQVEALTPPVPTGLTDGQLRDRPVEVTSAALTEVELRANPVVVGGEVRVRQNTDDPEDVVRIAGRVVGAMNVTDRASRELGIVSLSGTSGALSDIKRSLTDYETRLDYSGRTDSLPVYVGKALNGAATSSPEWNISKLSFDASNRLTRQQVLAGFKWDDRSILAW